MGTNNGAQDSLCKFTAEKCMVNHITPKEKKEFKDCGLMNGVKSMRGSGSSGFKRTAKCFSTMFHTYVGLADKCCHLDGGQCRMSNATCQMQLEECQMSKVWKSYRYRCLGKAMAGVPDFDKNLAQIYQSHSVLQGTAAYATCTGWRLPVNHSTYAKNFIEPEIGFRDSFFKLSDDRKCARLDQDLTSFDDLKTCSCCAKQGAPSHCSDVLKFMTLRLTCMRDSYKCNNVRQPTTKTVSKTNFCSFKANPTCWVCPKDSAKKVSWKTTTDAPR
jgi:hypothetical protein